MLKNFLEVFKEPCSSYFSKCKIKKKTSWIVKPKTHLLCCEDHIFSAMRIYLTFTQLLFLILSCLTSQNTHCCEGLDNKWAISMQFYLWSTAAISWVCCLLWKGNQYTLFFPWDLLSIALLTDWSHRASSASACLQGYRKSGRNKELSPVAHRSDRLAAQVLRGAQALHADYSAGKPGWSKEGVLSHRHDAEQPL